MRFYDVTDGKIVVDGRPTAEITRASLRKNFATRCPGFAWKLKCSISFRSGT